MDRLNLSTGNLHHLACTMAGGSNIVRIDPAHPPSPVVVDDLPQIRLRNCPGQKRRCVRPCRRRRVMIDADDDRCQPNLPPNFLCAKYTLLEARRWTTSHNAMPAAKRYPSVRRAPPAVGMGGVIAQRGCGWWESAEASCPREKGQESKRPITNPPR